MADPEANMAAYTLTEVEPVTESTLLQEFYEAVKPASSTNIFHNSPTSEGDIVDLHPHIAAVNTETGKTDKPSQPELTIYASSTDIPKDSPKMSPSKTQSVKTVDTASFSSLDGNCATPKSSAPVLRMNFPPAMPESPLGGSFSAPEIPPVSDGNKAPVQNANSTPSLSRPRGSPSTGEVAPTADIAFNANLDTNGSSGALAGRADASKRASKVSLSREAELGNLGSTPNGNFSVQESGEQLSLTTNLNFGKICTSTNDLVFHSTRGSSEQTNADGSHEAIRKQISNRSVSMVLQEIMDKNQFGEEAKRVVKAVSHEILKAVSPSEDLSDMKQSEQPEESKSRVESLQDARSFRNCKSNASSTNLSDAARRGNSLTALLPKSASSKAALSVILDATEPDALKSPMTGASTTDASLNVEADVTRTPCDALPLGLPILVGSSTFNAPDETVTQVQKRSVPDMTKTTDIEPIEKISFDAQLLFKPSGTEVPTKLVSKLSVPEVMTQVASKPSGPEVPTQVVSEPHPNESLARLESKISSAEALAHAPSKVNLPEFLPRETSNSGLTASQKGSKPSVATTPIQLSGRSSVSEAPDITDRVPTSTNKQESRGRITKAQQQAPEASLEEAAKEALVESPKQTLDEALAESPKQTLEEALAESPKQTEEALVESPKQTLEEALVETPRQTLEETFVEAAKDVLAEAPIEEAANEVPVLVESPRRVLEEALVEEPEETPPVSALDESLKREKPSKKDPTKKAPKVPPKEVANNATKSDEKRRDHSTDFTKGTTKVVKKSVGKAIPRLTNAAMPPDGSASATAAKSSASATSNISSRTEKSFKQSKSSRPVSARSSVGASSMADSAAGLTGIGAHLSAAQRVAAARAAAAGARPRKASGGGASVGTTSLTASDEKPVRDRASVASATAGVPVTQSVVAAAASSTTGNTVAAYGGARPRATSTASTAPSTGAQATAHPPRRQATGATDGTHRVPGQGAVSQPGGPAQHGAQRSKAPMEITSLEASYSSAVKSFVEAKKDADAKAKHACDILAKVENFRHVASTKFGKDLPLPEAIAGLTDSKAVLVRPVRGAGEDVAFSEDSSRALAVVESALRSMCDHKSALFEDTASHHAGILTWCLEAVGDNGVPSGKLLAEKEFADELIARTGQAKSAEQSSISEVTRVLRTSMADLDATKACVRELRTQLELLNQENSTVTSSLAECTKELEGTRAESAKMNALKATVEKESKVLRSKLKDFEGKASADEKRVKELTAQLRSLEDKVRAKDMTQDHRVRDTERRIRERMSKEHEDMQRRFVDLTKEKQVLEDKLQTTSQQMDLKLASVTQMLDAVTKDKIKAEEELQVALEKISKMKKDRNIGIPVAQQEERDALIQRLLESAASGEAADTQNFREKLEALTEMLDDKERVIGEKDAEIKRLREVKDSGDSSLVSKEQLEKIEEAFSKLHRHNEQLEEELSKMTQAAAKRERDLGEEENALLIRDQLMALLQGSNNHVAATGLAATAGIKILALQKKTLDLQSSTERQAVRIKALESQLEASERHQNNFHKIRTDCESRIAELECQLNDQRNSFRPHRQLSHFRNML